MNTVKLCGKRVTIRHGERKCQAIMLLFAVPGLLAFSSCGEQSIEQSDEHGGRRQAIQRVSLTSTVIPKAGYDADRRTLEIEFHNGSVYQYFGVPRYVYQDLKNADDPAQYFNQYVRKAGYRYRQIAVGGTTDETAGLRYSHEHEQDN